MEIIDLNKNKSKYETAVALGNFDGIHRGHQYLIKDTIVKGQEKNLKPSVLLFKNHTKTIINKHGNKIGILTSNEQKLNILKEMGIEIVYTMDFNEAIMKLTGEEFVAKILIDKLNARLVTVGFDYRFGHKASGDSKYLESLGSIYGFHTNVIRPIYIDDDLVSSTRIRNLIQEGKVKKAKELLARPYVFIGKVIKGSQRGNKLGFPTANIELLDNFVIPKTGVYITRTKIKDKKYFSLTNIGYNPTFHEEKLKIETHILNFKDNIYGETLKIFFLDFIRDDIKFDTAEELIAQIKKDIKYVKTTENIYN